MCCKQIHPGKQILSLLEETGISRKDLAVRTQVTEKHINTLISGERNITVSYAKKLGYIFEGKDAAYWQSAQSAYDLALVEQEEEENISVEEKQILKNLDDIWEYFVKHKYVDQNKIESHVDKIIELRKFLKISELTSITKMSYNAAYRAQLSTNTLVDPYVLFAWQTICEKETDNIQVASELNISLLKEKLMDIKNLMFDKIGKGCEALQSIFASCGIAFKVVRNFKGAPVQGFIKQTTKGKLILCLTIRRARADTFWFTLFHEIAHVINGDYKKVFVDFDAVSNENELKADKWARDFLIPKDKYSDFVKSHKSISWESIENFAKEINVQPFIVLGRLQKDQILDWSNFASKVAMYKWIENV
ncbi:MAG: ImmA/IrrE family metallo-endopeptidase [Succinivibrionaceae bacterium]